MGEVDLSGFESDWEVILSFLPDGWKQKARELGALKRCRKFADAESLLRTLLIHFAEGCSLRETVVRAREGGVASISDVALLKRIKASGEWFRWMASHLMLQWIPKHPEAVFGKRLTIRLIDGTTIQEPGATGSSWRVHYAVRLPSLQCDEVHVTTPKAGESFKRFKVSRGELIIADRGYGYRPGIKHVIDHGGDVLVRISLDNLPLVNEQGERFPLLPRLRSLKTGELSNWDVWIPFENGARIGGRVCAVKKSKQAAERARQKSWQENSRKSRRVQPETIESAGYTFIFTTFDRRFGPASILEMYRGRWQIELAFKRLKSIVGLGHLKKTDLESAKAWLHGKLFVAFLIETMITASESIFPWGYPIAKDQENSLYMAGNLADAPFT